MVQKKHQKSKPKKQSQGKKHGKQVDISEFRAQLDALGLKIVQVTADGNCFFRAMADQLEGNEEEHEKYRSMVVQYIMKNREMFEPFIEDDMPFDEYCKSMEKDGTWAGHMELQAASLLTRNNICIHRHMSPRWYIRNFDNQGANMIHLSYHDGEHYNSVRLKEDPCDGPARPIIIKADVTLTASSQQARTAGAPSKTRTSKNDAHGGAVKLVMAGSGCEDASKAKQVFLQVGGDVDAAIELLVAEREEDESGVICENNSNGNSEDRQSDKHEQDKDFVNGKEQAGNVKRVDDSKLSCKVAKVQKIPRNKVCPCGSKKKYKACCGAASGKTYSKLVVESEADSSRVKGGKKQGKKVVPVEKAASRGSDEALPDMGALCI